tara:strand:- start:714 stop:1265 length:552 start_codon:yes stop_codon:yes gene_type:complete
MLKIFRNNYLSKTLSIFLAFNVIILTSSFSFVPKKVKIPAGTLVTLRLIQSVSSTDCSEGDIVNLSVLYDVKSNDKTLITAGTRATGIVSLCTASKGQGKPGEVGVDISNLRINGSTIPLSSSPIKNKGEDKTTLAWGIGIGACVLLFGIGIVAVFFIKGGDGVLKSGKIIEGNVVTDSEINL